MAKAEESAIEKSAIAVSSGSLMLVGLLLIADASFGILVSDLKGLGEDLSGWTTVLAVPVLTVVYMLGIMVMTGSEIAPILFRHIRHKQGEYRFKEQDVFEVVAKNDLLLKQFEDVVRHRRILQGSFFPLLILGFGLLCEKWAGHFPNPPGLLIASAVAALILAILCLLFLKGLDFTLSRIWEVGLNNLQVNLSLSIECDRKPFSDSSDLLFITAKLAKQDRWSMALHDVQARVYEKKDEKAWTLLPDLAIKFDDFLRMGFETKVTEAWPPRQGTISWGVPSPKRRFITLSPGDSMEMSDSCIVPRGVMYKVEVVVLTVHPVEKECIEAYTRPFSQWRSSKIVYPCPPLLLDRLKLFSRRCLKGRATAPRSKKLSWC
jgi:hypothetical protein